MLKYVFIIYLMLFCCQNGIAQEKSEPVIDKDLWFVWLDATIDINGETKHYASDKLQEMYCCVRSKRYRKYMKKLEMELKEKIDKKFKIKNQIKKVNHPTLAKELIEKAQKRDNVIIISLKTSCP